MLKKLKASNGVWLHILEELNKCNDVSGKLGYAISKAKKNIFSQLQPFEEQRKDLFQKYGEKKEGQDFLSIETNSENYKNFVKELSPIADIIIEIPIFQITQEEFENNESLFNNKDIKVEEYNILQYLFIASQQEEEE